MTMYMKPHPLFAPSQSEIDALRARIAELEAELRKANDSSKDTCTCNLSTISSISCLIHWDTKNHVYPLPTRDDRPG